MPANTVVDLQRFQNDLAAITPGHEVQLFSTGVISRNFVNGYIGTWTTGFDQDIRGVKLNVAYVGTAGVHLASVFSPNGYAGADPEFAPFTQFNSAGHAIGGFGPEAIMSNGSHSSYHALQSSVTENYSGIGLSLQASYTFSKSIDDTSAVLGGLPANAGTILQTLPQDPRNPEADKGPSTFDVRNVFSLSVIQVLAVRSHRISGAAEHKTHARLAIFEHYEHHERATVHRVFRNSANGSRRGRHRSTGSRFDAGFFDEPAYS